MSERIRYDLAFTTYGRSIGERASFALKFGFIAEKFAQPQAYGVKGGNFDVRGSTEAGLIDDATHPYRIPKGVLVKLGAMKHSPPTLFSPRAARVPVAPHAPTNVERKMRDMRIECVK